MDNQRRAEFRKANDEQRLITGSLFIIKELRKLNEAQHINYKRCYENKNINSLYILKEQLQTLWQLQQLNRWKPH